MDRFSITLTNKEEQLLSPNAFPKPAWRRLLRVFWTVCSVDLTWRGYPSFDLAF